MELNIDVPKVLLELGLKHIEAATKWIPFRKHFQVHFREWKYLNSD